MRPFIHLNIACCQLRMPLSKKDETGLTKLSGMVLGESSFCPAFRLARLSTGAGPMDHTDPCQTNQSLDRVKRLFALSWPIAGLDCFLRAHLRPIIQHGIHATPFSSQSFPPSFTFVSPWRPGQLGTFDAIRFLPLNSGLSLQVFHHLVSPYHCRHRLRQQVTSHEISFQRKCRQVRRLRRRLACTITGATLHSSLSIGNGATTSGLLEASWATVLPLRLL